MNGWRLGALALVVWVLIFALFLKVRLGHPVPVRAGAVPDEFPVLLVIDGDDRNSQGVVVFSSALDDYLRAHPSATFLIPPGRGPALRRAVKSQRRLQVGESGPGDFRVTRHEDGTQDLRVTGTWRSGQYIEIGWYTATAHGFSPSRYHRTEFVRCAVVFAGIAATPAAGAVLLVVALIFRRRPRHAGSSGLTADS